MNISIQDAINGIDEQIEELKKQKEMIANFDINEPIDENDILHHFKWWFPFRFVLTV